MKKICFFLVLISINVFASTVSDNKDESVFHLFPELRDSYTKLRPGSQTLITLSNSEFFLFYMDIEPGFYKLRVVADMVNRRSRTDSEMWLTNGHLQILETETNFIPRDSGAGFYHDDDSLGYDPEINFYQRERGVLSGRIQLNNITHSRDRDGTRYSLSVVLQKCSNSQACR